MPFLLSIEFTYLSINENCSTCVSLIHCQLFLQVKWLSCVMAKFFNSERRYLW